jgi:hypothetical protein
MFKHIVILYVLVTASCSAQTKVSLPNLRIEYELPAKWESKEFFKDNWETPGGNNVCKCGGVINSFKVPGGGDFDYMYMALYPSDRKGANAEKRQGVWQYKFVPVEKVDTVKTDYLVWEKHTSKLKPYGSSDNRFRDFTAYKYETHFGNTYFTMFIWAKPYMLQQYKAILEAMVASMKAIS